MQLFGQELDVVILAHCIITTLLEKIQYFILDAFQLVPAVLTQFVRLVGNLAQTLIQIGELNLDIVIIHRLGANASGHIHQPDRKHNHEHESEAGNCKNRKIHDAINFPVGFPGRAGEACSGLLSVSGGPDDAGREQPGPRNRSHPGPAVPAYLSPACMADVKKTLNPGPLLADFALADLLHLFSAALFTTACQTTHFGKECNPFRLRPFFFIENQ